MPRIRKGVRTMAKKASGTGGGVGGAMSKSIKQREERKLGKIV